MTGVNRYGIVLAGCALSLLAVGACGSDSKSSTTTAGAAAATTASATAAPTTAPTTATTAPRAATAATTPMATTGSTTAMSSTVSIGDFTFEPADLHVPVGATVTWTNDHTQPHTATSAGNFDTGAIQPGESKTVTFDEAGTYSYICSFHPFMTATVTVG